MGWEPYDKPHVRLPNKPYRRLPGLYASLRKSGTFHLPVEARRHMSNPYTVGIFLDRDRKHIGFQSVPKETDTPNTHRLDSVGDVSLATLRSEWELEAGRYPVRFEGDMVVIDCTKKEW